MPITNREARTLKVSLDFLETGKSYTAALYTDGPDADYNKSPYPVLLSTQTVDSNSLLELELARGGGAAIKFAPVVKNSTD